MATEVTAGRDNGRRRPRGYASWSPRAATRTLVEQVQRVLVEYADHLPLTVRQVFYRLVATADYPKTENAYARLCDHLVRARRARVIPFDSLRDDGITTLNTTCYEGVEDFHDETSTRARRYRRDRQEGQAVRVELWCEAAGMLPQLHRVGEEYSVPVFSAGGFASLSAVRLIVNRARNMPVPLVLLHVGDFDPSGASIFEHLGEDAAAFLRDDRVLALQRIDPVRVALTADQVSDFDLPTAPPKRSDSRSARWAGETCQLEALAPDELAYVVRKAIFDYLDVPRYERALEAETRDRAELLGLPSGEQENDKPPGEE